MDFYILSGPLPKFKVTTYALSSPFPSTWAIHTEGEDVIAATILHGVFRAHLINISDGIVLGQKRLILYGELGPSCVSAMRDQTLREISELALDWSAAEENSDPEILAAKLSLPPIVFLERYRG